MARDYVDFRLPEWKLVDGPDEWSNGYTVWHFEVFDIKFKLMQHYMDAPDDDEYTRLSIEDRTSDNVWFREHEHPWIEKWGVPYFPGIVTPEGAVQIINFARGYFERGIERGKVLKQIEIKKVLDVK